MIEPSILTHITPKPSQSGSGSNGNEGVHHIPQNFSHEVSPSNAV